MCCPAGGIYVIGVCHYHRGRLGDTLADQAAARVYGRMIYVMHMNVRIQGFQAENCNVVK